MREAILLVADSSGLIISFAKTGTLLAGAVLN